ncbi:MAG TPA: hypothetical protein VGN14_07990 [Candidatus Elarobacter sp.]
MRNPLRLICIVVVAGLVPAGGTFASGAPAALAHHAVTTRSAAAQSEFDQGLTLMYAFNPEEATFHFQEAIRADPTCAMAYWGIALAAGPNVNTTYDDQRASIGREAIAAARGSNVRASDEERGYVDALARRYAAASAAQIPAAQNAYAAAMAALARRYPNDPDAETLAAEALMDLTPLAMWRHDGSPNGNTRRVIAMLDDVLRRDPAHLGANHYLIHAWEDAPDPRPALVAARRLATLDLPPAAEHLAHMPAHIFTKVGDYDAAIAASLRAVALFRAYIPQQHSAVHNGYYPHDLQVLDYAYMMTGQWAKARDVATEVAHQVDDNGAAADTYVRFHRWRELRSLPAPSQPGLRWRWAQGMAAAGSSDMRSAQATLSWLDSLHDRDPRTGIARDLLGASIDARSHRDDRAIASLRDAVRLEDGLAIKEPPAWYYPIRETLGARLALAHRYREAEQTFNDDLRRNPANPRSLYGLAQVEMKTDPGRAAQMQAAYRRAWSHADTPLSLDAL